MRVFKIITLTLFLCMFFCDCSSASAFKRIDMQYIYLDNDKMLTAIFNKEPLNTFKEDKIYFNYSKINNTLYLYLSNKSTEKPIYNIKLTGIEGDYFFIKQFIDVETEKTFYNIYACANNSLNGHCYLIGQDKNNNFKMYVNTKDFNVKEKGFLPVFHTEKGNLILDFVYLAGKQSKKFEYILQYNANTDTFNVINKGLIRFDIDTIQRR